MFRISTSSSLTLGKVLESCYDLTEYILAYVYHDEFHLQATHAIEKTSIIARVVFSPLGDSSSPLDASGIPSGGLNRPSGVSGGQPYCFQLAAFVEVWKQLNPKEDVQISVSDQGWVLNGLPLTHQPNAFLSDSQRLKNISLFQLSDSVDDGLRSVMCCVLLSTHLLITAILYVSFGNGECECRLVEHVDETKFILSTRSHVNITTSLIAEPIRSSTHTCSTSLLTFVRFLRIFLPCLSLVPKIRLVTMDNAMCFGFNVVNGCKPADQPDITKDSVWLGLYTKKKP